MSQGKILAIDDEQNIRTLIANEFAVEGFDVTTAKSGEEGLKVCEKEKFDVVLLDIRLPKMNGIEVLRRLKEKMPGARVIMITAHGDIKTAVESMKLGAQDYVTKPFKLEELLGLVKQALGNGQNGGDPHFSEPALAAGGAAGFIHCPNRAMQDLYDLVAKVAPTDKTILIQGETGVGKDVVAHQIHALSRRKEGPFIILDCGILNQNLAESELYGHTKGAFSGASEKRSGLVEQSHGGTLFLDEIGNIELELQKKFLRFLETKRFRRLGETRETEIDPRIILATHLDLKEAVARGTMRKDLFYRIDVILISIPPLRKRPEDVPPLARHFLGLEQGIVGVKKISSEAMRVMTEYAWPGNIRELRSAINKAVIFARTDTITPNDLPSELRRNVPVTPQKTLEDLEKNYILTILERTGGNQSEAAKILGINRKTLYKKIHKFKILN
ncbi:MAG: sigma-54-dependent transcriptional regulator [Desulfobaccales bacterium]